MAKPANASQPSYLQVKKILNAIQGDTVPEYQGYRAFWLAHEVFTTVVLYGQRMIAPDEGSGGGDADPGSGGCCGGSGDVADGSHGMGGESFSPALEAVNTQPSGKVTANCWPSGGSGGSGAGGGGKTKRSDRSGIIIGLRGAYPFDGSIFPPLLWDAARRATEAEIKTIADWIDSGCPEKAGKRDDDKAKAGEPVRVSVSLPREEKIALACGDKRHPVSSRCTNVEHKDIKGLSVRKEISTLTDTELGRLRSALDCMYQYNPYWQDERSFDHWARIHTDSCQHGWEQFLPWHRLYLYFFEQTLQDFDPYITLPYWSWSDYADANKTTFNNTEPDLGVIPEAYRCWLTPAGLDRLKDMKDDSGKALFTQEEIAGLEKVVSGGATYNSGLRLLKAADIAYGLVKDPQTGSAAWSLKIRAVYNVLREINALWFPNRWPGAVMSPASYPTKQNIDNILALNDWHDFGGGPEYDHHFGALEQVHNGMHNFSGGQNPCFPGTGNSKWISIYEKLGIPTADPQNRENPPFGWMTDNRITAFDPIFWAHHANVDRLWARWQELHPSATPDDQDGVLAPWSMIVSDTLNIRKLGYEYMRDTFVYSTASDTAITRFHGEKCGVCQTVLDTHRKADIRLHRVQRGNMHNASIRLFLNQPDADIDTPMDNNDHFVGEVTTFHGTCFGGPGHCDLPLEKNRQFDQRKLHHHEPRNFRLDATETVRKLLAKGEQDLSVDLVVVGLDGQAMDRALYIDGVSLNFLD